jgi:DNA/RNA-binding domain of Phe-tRNA-synthetase-like protein
MMEIRISSKLKSVCSELTLGCIQCKVKTEKFNKQLWKEIEKVSRSLSKEIILEQIYKLPKIKEAREAYKKMGKDPTRYRVSSEALIRRILQGKRLYQINNVVDINNLVSLKSFYSVGSYDFKKLSSPVEFEIGEDGKTFKGIGKELVNIENLPVFVDSIGPFGSPTSDSERAMITTETIDLLMMVISFSGEGDIAKTLEYAGNLLEKYAEATHVEIKIVK